MAELTPTEADPPGSSSKQLLNVIWNRGGIEVPPYVGLGVSKYGRQISEYSDDDRHYQPAQQGRAINSLERQIFSVHVSSPTTSTPEHQVYSPRPVFTRAGTTTALHGTEVYFSVSTHGYDCPSPNLDRRKCRMPHYVWKYNCVEELCSVIEESLHVHDFGLAVVNEQLVVVGGETDQTKRYRSISHDFRSRRQRSGARKLEVIDSEIVLPYIGMLDLNKAHYGWQCGYFPEMPKPRKQPAVICMKQYLVVAGGQDGEYELLSLVEVLNTESKVWSQVTNLPEPVRSLTAALCDNQLYFLGGIGSDGSTCSVFKCPVESIKEFCDGSIEKAVKWQNVCDTPLFRSSCVVYNDELYAVGGRTSTYRTSSDIYCYDSNLDSWILVNQQLPTARSMCIAAATKNKLVVIGGLVQDDEPTDITEIGTCISGMLIEYFKSLYSHQECMCSALSRNLRFLAIPRKPAIL